MDIFLGTPCSTFFIYKLRQFSKIVLQNWNLHRRKGLVSLCNKYKNTNSL